MNLDQEVIAIVADAMGLDAANTRISRETALFGAHPDFNSMVVLAVMTGLEERLCLVLDDTLDADSFRTLGTLIDAVAANLRT